MYVCTHARMHACMTRMFIHMTGPLTPHDICQVMTYELNTCKHIKHTICQVMTFESVEPEEPLYVASQSPANRKA